MFDQDLVAALADPGAVLLQAGQHDLVAVIHDGAAVTDYVAGAGVVLALAYLRNSSRSKPNRGKGKRDEREQQSRPDHLFIP
jgi:hypothetical protein